jgi:HTH-type transcriptional regulator, glycine betaine synthesis regulator
MPADRAESPRPQRSSLTEVQDRFVAAWGQMAGAWGISRTMAEVHALLYITGEPLNTDDVMARLEISRGNASMSLRALLDWGIIERAHKRGDRKEYFTAQQDVWTMFRAIVRERVKREVDPLIASLYELGDMSGGQRGEKAANPDERKQLAATHERIESLVAFFKTLEGLSRQFVSPAGRGLQLAATLLAKVGEK